MSIENPFGNIPEPKKDDTPESLESKIRRAPGELTDDESVELRDLLRRINKKS